MDYYFSDFHFNSASLLLSQHGQAIAIRNNEAKMLAFFLAAPEQVFSKDAILEHVWAGKVVSEQAVFQAISNLRSVFGEDAIKTFPKKGYRWQIALQQNPAQQNTMSADQLLTITQQTTTQATHPDTSASNNRARAPWWMWSCAALLMVGLLFALLFKQPATNSATQNIAHIVVEPFVLDANNTGAQDIAQQVQTAVIAQLNNQASLRVHMPPSNHSPDQVAAEPAHFLTLYNKTITANLLLSGRVRQVENQVVLSFVLQGRQRQW